VLIDGLIIVLIDGLISGLIGGLIGGLIYGLIERMKAGLDTRSTPNQGILASAKTTAILMVVFTTLAVLSQDFLKPMLLSVLPPPQTGRPSLQFLLWESTPHS
jgi:uncharacterized membrane protein (UPF0136 family)